MNKEPIIDFSKHTLSITKSPEIITHHLHKNNSFMLSVKFTNLLKENVLLVTGDFSNWIFNRAFIPSGESDLISIPYWLEKLRMNSYQDPSSYDSDLTLEMIEEILNDEDLELSQHQIQFYNDLKNYVDDEITYMYEAFRNKPMDIDYEQIPVGKKMNPQLEIVFGAYQEICNRLKEV